MYFYHGFVIDDKAHNFNPPGEVMDKGPTAEDELSNPFTIYVNVEFKGNRWENRNLGSLEELVSLSTNKKSQQLKAFVRENTWPSNHTIRSKLWLELCKRFPYQNDNLYGEDAPTVFGNADRPHNVPLPQFVDPTYMMHYHLNEEGQTVIKKVVCIIGYERPDITFAPFLYPLACLLLHYMEEVECFNCVMALLRNKQGFIFQTKIYHRAAARTLVDLCKKYTKSTYNFINKQIKSFEHDSDSGDRAKIMDSVEHVFDEWLWWIFRDLPFNYVVRIIDCYLNESIKVLFRVALAILQLYHKYSGKIDGNKKIDCSIKEKISTFCQTIPYPVEKLLKAAYGIRGLPQSELSRLLLKNEMLLKAHSPLNPLVKSVSLQSVDLHLQKYTSPTAHQGPMSLQFVNSHTLTHGQPPIRASSVGVLALAGFRSAIINMEELFTVWHWLPQRITIYQPQLLYTTEEHGTSLTTFYSRVGEHEPILLLIKTTNNEVFGAYCSVNWNERRQHEKNLSYFGTGETFIFSISPTKQKYPWIGITQDHISHGAQLFMAGDSTMITIGGGGGQALRLDASLQRGSTETCETFNNPPLCSTRDFDCRVIEVFGFAT